MTTWQNGPQSSSASDLIETVVAQVFPPGTRLTWRAGDVPPAERYCVVAGAKGPRWIVPWPGRVGSGVLAAWRPYTAAAILGWSALRAAYRTGLHRRLPGVRCFGVAGSADWSHLGWSREAPVSVTYIGTPGPTQKAVAHLLPWRDGACQRVAKVPLGPKAARTILLEAEMLGRLAEEKPGVAPCVRFVDRKNGRTLQDVVAGKASGRRLEPRHVDWLAGLRRDGHTISIRDHAKRLSTNIQKLRPDVPGRERLLDRLEAQMDDSLLPSVWTHGDFAPWNIKNLPGGGVAAIDWGDAECDGLPLHDLFYYYLNQDSVFSEQEWLGPRCRKAASQYAASMGWDAGMLSVITEVAVLSVAVKAWSMGRDDLGALAIKRSFR